jgi:hypothetical protein
MKEQSYQIEDGEYQQLLLVGLEEGVIAKLLFMKEHLSEQIEYRELEEESRRLSFIRWLIEHDRISH